ncbi:MAG: VCBS repeat-containing protein [Acidobacteria bacterium]|nr:VCBS repeat-containing protein [Acidobacteriota bacterium]
MKKFIVPAVLFVAIGLIAVFWMPITKTVAQFGKSFLEREPDMPSLFSDDEEENEEMEGRGMSKEEFLTKRAEAFALLRGLNNDQVPDPKQRLAAVERMEKQQELLKLRPQSPEKRALTAAWTAIGPAPIVSGTFRYSGRTIAIAVHPTNPNIVYVGTAQGGLYRTTDGGTNWTALMDNAQSLAIGAIAIAPSNPEIVYVGTGEPNFSADSFFGVGVYRIDNASTTATVSGPFNRDGSNIDVMTGRGVGEIVVHPTDPNTIFVATTSGIGGIGGVANNVLPSRGIYRSTNAAGATPTFAKLTGLAANANSSVRDIAIDPSNANILVANVVASGGVGGIYRSTDALGATPTFTQVQTFTSTSTSELTAEFAAIHPPANANATFYAATGNGAGRLLMSIDGGATWTQQIANSFCSPQCFYDIAVAVDPVDPTRVYLGGSPTLVAAFSTNSGTSFLDGGSATVHVDTHALAVAPSNASIVYVGTDGGIYKSTNGGSSYLYLNNSQFYATQFMSIAVHPTDPNFTIGGTQDNGTNYYDPAGSAWTRVDGGDGGYTVIDQNAADTTNVRMYHTYYNQTGSLLGYATRGTTSAGWGFRGCNGASANGINCSDTNVLFYAPLEQGPGTPNSIYYGTDRLYRSGDLGVTHTVVSQAPIASGIAISAIGVSPQNDNVRIVGLQNGGLWGTTTGSSTLVDLDPTNAIPNGFVARAVVDPSNVNTAYVTLSNFGVQNVWKTTNLNAAPPTWTNITGTIPLVPVSAFVVDPTNSNNLYAGTDIGVYASTDGGTSWAPFGTGLPRVAVFDMAIAQGSPRKLRIATHGKGMFEIPLVVAPTGQKRVDFDGDAKTDISIFRPSAGEWWYSKSSTGGNAALAFGTATDKLVPADFTGDSKTDIAFWRPSTGFWYVLRSEDNTFFSFPFGTTGDTPVVGDFDGDGKNDPTVFRPSNSTWYISKTTGGTSIVTFGATGDLPIPADYDGDGKADVAIYRPSVGEWWINRSTTNVTYAFQFGTSTDKLVPGDYTGDGKADAAFFRPSTGFWYILRSEDSSFFSFPFGATGDSPSPGDYDGDGKFDPAVFRPSTSTWYVNRTTAGLLIASFGTTGDLSVPNSFVP